MRCATLVNMTDRPEDPIRDPGYWSDLIDSFEDQEAPPDPASMAADDVNRMLGSLRRLMGRVADYDLLHIAELGRLQARRDKMVGPVIERVQALEQTLRDYGVRAFTDFGKTGTILAAPNGSIRAGRELVTDLSIHDAAVEPWLKPLAPDAVSYTPKVSKADLRYHLEQGVIAGTYRQAIVVDRATSGVVAICVLEPGAKWSGLFDDRWAGVWVRPTHNAAAHPFDVSWPAQGEVIPDPDGAIVAGVTWKPTGEQGCGRSFTIDIS